MFLIKFLGVCDEEEKTPATHLPDLPPGQRSSEKTTCLEACRAAARQNAQFFVRGQTQMIFCWKNQSSCQRRSLSSSSGLESLPAEGRRCVRPVAATRWRQVARLLASLARSSGTARTSLASPQRSRDQLFTRKSTAPRRPPLPNQTSAYSAYHCCFGQFKLWPCKAQTDARK